MPGPGTVEREPPPEVANPITGRFLAGTPATIVLIPASRKDTEDSKFSLTYVASGLEFFFLLHGLLLQSQGQQLGLAYHPEIFVELSLCRCREFEERICKRLNYARVNASNIVVWLMRSMKNEKTC